jgi:signal transduction histidine kinase
MIISVPPRRATILLVDDELSNRVLIRYCLESEYEVLEAADGASALALLERETVDLVLLDVMMPDMSGFEVCRRIKNTRSDYLPVILLTALDQQAERNAGLDAGADDFLSKPVDREELLLRVRTFVRLRQKERRIVQQFEALRERDQVIQKQVEELKQLDVIKDDLVAMMVHDLRNPLAGIMGFLDSIAGETKDPALRSDADMALRSSLHLREILNDMLHVRMLECGTVRLHRELMQATSVMEEAIESVWGAGRERRVGIAPVIAAPDLRVDVDRKLIRRAVENLLTNAVKYSPNDTFVRASVQPFGAEVRIEVADRGEGVPDELKQQLFQKFGSVEAARGTLRQGVGLGLYLVKLAANAHGGRAEVRDRKSGGSAFSMVLPRAG